MPSTTTTTGATTQSLQDQCNPELIGDDYCDDKIDCNYDGGDCCGCNVNKQHYLDCQCFDLNQSSLETTCPQTKNGTTSQKTQDKAKTGQIDDIVRTSITTWTATMMVETVVDVMSKQNTAQIANALILMEVGMEQHALNNNNNW